MPRKPSVEERVKKYMTTLNLSYEDALKVVQDDDTIDNGGKCEWEKEMTPEQKKIARKARMADREVKKEKAKRTRKENPDKKDLIVALANALYDKGVEDYEITNAEREISFNYNGTAYKITLSAPRAPKEQGKCPFSFGRVLVASTRVLEKGYRVPAGRCGAYLCRAGPNFEGTGTRENFFTGARVLATSARYPETSALGTCTDTQEGTGQVSHC